jgi:hypothetical protein
MSGVFQNIGGKEKHPLTEFYTDLNIEQKTELDREDIRNIIEIEYLSDYFKTHWNIDLDLKKGVTVPFKQHMVSNKREGRKKGMKIMEAQEVHQNQESTNKGIVDRALGR